MSQIAVCKLCGQKALKPFFYRAKYPIWGGPVIAANQTGHLGYASLQIGICPNCSFMSLMQPRAEELSSLLYEEFYSSSNPVCNDPENVSDWRVLQLLELIDQRMGSATGHALEIASYDGQFLYQLRKRGWTIAGCEPNPIGQQAAQKYGFEVKQSFFTQQLYPPKTFDLVVCRFVLEHVPAPLEFLDAARENLKMGGRIFVEVPECADRVINRVLGSFVPEHVSYFCEKSLAAALEKSGFGDIEFRIYQGGMIATAERVASPETELSEHVSAELLHSADTFEAAVREKLESLHKIVKKFVLQGKRIAIYGANTQTIEYFNRGGVDEADVSYVVDDDPYKQGMQLVGTGLPVFHFERLMDSPVDCVLVSAYLSQEKMVAAIRERCGPGLAVIRFYPEPSVEQ